MRFGRTWWGQQWLAAQYQRAHREARTFDRDAGTPWPEAERLDAVSARIDDNGALIEMRANGKRLFKMSGNDDAVFAEFLAGLHAIPAERETRLAHTVLLWRTALRLAS